MKKHRINDFFKGWIIGDFDPSLIKTREFEVAYKEYPGEYLEKPHYHKIADEFTLIIEGEVSINNTIYKSGDIVHIKPLEISHFKSIKPTKTMVVKVPSVQGDKYIVESN